MSNPTSNVNSNPMYYDPLLGDSFEMAEDFDPFPEVLIPGASTGIKDSMIKEIKSVEAFFEHSWGKKRVFKILTARNNSDSSS